ncbi:MAG: threonine/serine exporter family protein [Planctomycetota bacterium]
MTTLLMLTMGVILGTQIGTAILGFDPPDVVSVAMPAWFVPVSLLVAGLSLGVLFRTAPRDLPWSVVAVGLPWIAFKVGLGEIGREASIFVGAIIAGVFANLFARMFDRPSMIVRLPGILILVPGSASLSLDAVAHGNAQLGVETPSAWG